MPTAMIWGANGGIGRATISTATEKGMDIISFVHNETAENQIEVDVASRSSIEQAIYQAQFDIDEINLWVYAIGDIAQAPIGEMNEDVWMRILDANLSGAYRAYTASTSLLAEDATVVFVGAVSEKLHLPSLSAYAAAKAGLEAFVDTLRKEERKKTVALLRPGAVDTEFWDRVTLSKPKGAMSADKVADAIWQIYTDKQSGQQDI